MPGRRDQARHRARPEKWLSINTDYAKIWPNITAKKDDAPNDADAIPNEKRANSTSTFRPSRVRATEQRYGVGRSV